MTLANGQSARLPVQLHAFETFQLACAAIRGEHQIQSPFTQSFDQFIRAQLFDLQTDVRVALTESGYAIDEPCARGHR
ncbi:hypothetical protein D3C85_1678410 [compost metagenome]